MDPARYKTIGWLIECEGKSLLAFLTCFSLMIELGPFSILFGNVIACEWKPTGSVRLAIALLDTGSTTSASFSASGSRLCSRVC